MSKKRKPTQSVEVEKPRFLARGVGYSSSKFVGQSNSDRTHWIVVDDAECVPKDYQDNISKVQREAELEAQAERKKARREIAAKVAEVVGDRRHHRYI